MKLERKRLEKKYPIWIANLIMNSCALLFILLSPISVIVLLIKNGKVRIK